jgi:multicomponent Na+:H+ antiporter subunit F
MSKIILICILLLSVSAAFGVVRFIKGPNHSDRVVVFDLLASLLLGICLLLSMLYQDAIWIDVALVVALVAFVSTVGISYFLSQIKEP